MAQVLDRFLEHARSRSGVWISRGIDVAEWWLGQGEG
jgi:hypothetical protein